MLAKLSRLASDEMQTFLESHGIGNTELIVDVAHALVTKYGEASAAAACNLYDEIAEKQGKAVRSAEPAETASREKTAGVVYGSLKDSPEGKKLKQIPDRFVKQAAADTMLQNAKRDGAEWAWIPSGDGCAMCMTIASRGWLPASSAQLSGGHASHIHANCKCQFAIRFDKNLSVEGYEPEELKQRYDAAEGHGAKQKINYLRRKQYEKNGDEINAQKRAEYKGNRNNKLNTYFDPVREKIGSAEESNPEELRQFMDECRNKGVKICRDRSGMAYQPSPSPGKPGQIIMEPEASISAWYHEMQHMHDDEASGWNGFRIMINPENIKEFERRAYDIEIEFAKRKGYNDIVKRLEQLKANALENI